MRRPFVTTSRTVFRGALLVFAISAIACRSEPRRGHDEAARETLIVGAAASLGDVVEALRPLAEKSNLELAINAAGSNVLAMQIEAAPAMDIFLSADVEWVDRLDRRSRLRRGTRCAFLSNRLAVIVAAASPLVEVDSLEALANRPPRHLVLADPAAVPAGRYARRALERVRLANGDSAWDRLAERVVPSADVRAALALVASDPRTVGIVYATELRAASGRDDRRIRRLFDVPPELTPRIRYVAAAVADRPYPGRGDRFLALLTGAQATAIFAAHGFEPLPCKAWIRQFSTPSA